VTKLVSYSYNELSDVTFILISCTEYLAGTGWTTSPQQTSFLIYWLTSLFIQRRI